MNIVILIGLSVVVAVTEASYSYINQYDKPFTFSCPHGKAFSLIGSTHHNYHEDRIWSVDCHQKLPRTGGSQWTSYVNDFDGSMNFECADGNVMTGIGGYHSNHHEDRRYKFQCTLLLCLRKGHCFWTPYTNWDAVWQYRIPYGKFMTGMRSYHHNHKEDRRFSLQICTLH